MSDGKWVCKECGSDNIWAKLTDVYIGDDAYAGGDYTGNDAQMYAYYCEDCGALDEPNESLDDVAIWVDAEARP